MAALFIELGRVFMEAVNIAITAGWLVLAVVALRLVFKKAPKWVTCLLWAVVALRLLLPFSLESELSLIPSEETLPVTSVYSTDPDIADNPFYQKVDSGVDAIDEIVTPILRDTTPSAMRSIYSLLGCVWLAGVLGMLLYTAVSYLRLSRRTREGVLLEGRAYLCDRIDTPFILGILRPRVFLPAAMDAAHRDYVLAHEQAHLRRFDHLWKPLGFALLSVYWFNPLLWVAYILLCRDIELACDEKVIRELGTDSKAAYSEALISCSAPRRLVSACPLAFGEVGVKSRIQAVLHYKKPAFWLVLTAVVASLVLAVCFLTNPSTGEVWLSDRNGLFVNTISAECDNVTYKLLDSSAEPKDSYLKVEWENDTQDVLCFGQEYTLYKDNEPYQPEEIYWDLLLYIVKPRGNYIERYNLPHLPHGDYRLEKSFYLESDPHTKYRAFIDFTVDTTYSFINSTYRLESVVYETKGQDAPFDINDNNSRIFSVTQNKLLSVAEYGSDWHTLGELLPLVPGRKNFDVLFADANWQGGFLAPKLRRNNLHALMVSDPAYGRMAYLLEQKNGDIYLAYGSTVANKIYWVFKLAAAYQGSLNQQYPELLGLPTSKGLEVFVSKFSADGPYRCLLKSGKNLGYTNEELATEEFIDIKDMAKILATYQLSAEQIAVTLFQHPQSSFLWMDAASELPLIHALLNIRGNAAVVEIEDTAEMQNIPTDEALECFYEDDRNYYLFPSIRSQYVIVRLQNGDEIPVADALQQGLITVSDLDTWHIFYYTKPKLDLLSPPSLDIASHSGKQRAWMGGYDWTYMPLIEETAGQRVIQNADTPTALQAVQEGQIPAQVVYVTDQNPAQAELHFGLPPDKVTVLSYRLHTDGVWRQTKTHVLTETRDGIRLIEGDCLYVITAQWEENASLEYYGTVTYAFRANTQPVEEIPSTTTTPPPSQITSTQPAKKD